MPAADILINTLASPMVLAFILAVVVTALGSDLHLPKAISSGLSIYLLLAIGFKGGTALAKEDINDILVPLAVTAGIGIITPLIAYVIAMRVMTIDKIEVALVVVDAPDRRHMARLTNPCSTPWTAPEMWACATCGHVNRAVHEQHNTTNTRPHHHRCHHVAATMLHRVRPPRSRR